MAPDSAVPVNNAGMEYNVSWPGENAWFALIARAVNAEKFGMAAAMPEPGFKLSA